ncbi:MAG: M48 family metalloprotease [Bacteroidales bacterium]
MFLRISILFSLLFFSIYNNTTRAQIVDLNNYTYLKSEGTIPSGLLTSAYKKYQEEFPLKTISDKRRLALKKKGFYLKSNYALNSILESGRVVFGDELTLYVNKVADEVLKNFPEIRKDLKFYVLKSSSVNSISTSQGYIFINVGLLAKLRNEAELAFVISHEVAHYKDEHALNSYIDNIDLEKGKGKYNNLSFDDKIDLMFMNSRETELKADSVGATIFLTSNYNSNSAIEALDLLHYNYLPFEEVKFDKTFFNTNQFVIPNSFFLDSLKKISAIEDYRDVNHTHPNISKRKQKVKEVIGQPNNKKYYLVSENDFQRIRNIARFETVRLDLLRKSYGDVIYNSYVLLQQYPNNPFLKISIAKALYGLTLYKNIEEFQKVAKSYIRVEGESQQIHSLIKQLNKKQLNCLALSYTKRMLKEYPNDKVLNKIESQLIEELVVKNNLSIKDFKNYYAEGRNNFYFAAIPENELNNKTLLDIFEKAKIKADSLKRVEEMSVSAREKLERNNLKQAKKYGINRNINEVQIIDPFVSFYPMDKERDFQNSEKNEMVLISAINRFATEYNKPVKTLNSIDLKNSAIDEYNKISLYKEMIDDIFYNDNEIDMLPLGVPISQLDNNKGNLISRIGVFSDKDSGLLICIMVDLDNLDIAYSKSANIFKSLSERTLVQEFKDSFQVFK